ncbi:MAG: anti-sigma factor antagonist [Prochloraceae cyanobacterium]|nr:anti-sigma factor antagonist [Prochloraceae cyanobacterium]
MTFNATSAITNNIALITLVGELDGATASVFKAEVEKAAAAEIKKLVLIMSNLEYMASAGLRVLIFAKQKMGAGVDIYLVSPQETVLDTIEKTGFHHSVIIMDKYDPQQFA